MNCMTLPFHVASPHHLPIKVQINNIVQIIPAWSYARRKYHESFSLCRSKSKPTTTNEQLLKFCAFWREKSFLLPSEYALKKLADAESRFYIYSYTVFTTGKCSCSFYSSQNRCTWWLIPQIKTMYRGVAHLSRSDMLISKSVEGGACRWTFLGKMQNRKK